MNGPVLIMAGGTGGHIFPGLAVAQVLRERDVPVLWLGARSGMEGRLVPAQQISLETVDFGGIRGKSLSTRLLAPLRLLRAVMQARRVLRKHSPRSVLSMGGYAAAPGGIAAWTKRIPVIVHEQNSVAGFTNRLLAHIARKSLTGFPDVFHGPRAEWVGNPVRPTIAELPSPAQRFAERSGPLRLLVLGGSQGAKTLNANVPLAMATLSPDRFEVRHQCGVQHIDATQQAYNAASVRASVFSFIDDMAEAYGWADLVICRAGALTIAELSASGLGALLIPFPLAVDDHQTKNADALVKAGAARLIADSQVTPQALADLIDQACSSRTKLLAMAEAARTLTRAGAAQRIADC
ncbi:MAG: undecaprenyldiphospho-muramoylpentapeptide beta-N-acetylglucosaminyltransferase, partial [Dokdonella sp.]